MLQVLIDQGKPTSDRVSEEPLNPLIRILGVNISHSVWCLDTVYCTEEEKTLHGNIRLFHTHYMLISLRLASLPVSLESMQAPSQAGPLLHQSVVLWTFCLGDL